MTNKNQSILVIDDCADNLLLMELFLKGEGYAFDSASSGVAGLAKIYEHQPDLIILDLMMPDMSGLEIIQHLKRNYRLATVSTMLLTANSNFKRQDAPDIDAVCFKPFDFDSILGEIRSLLSAANHIKVCPLLT